MRIGIPDVMADHATPQQSFETLGLLPIRWLNGSNSFKLSLSFHDPERSRAQFTSFIRRHLRTKKEWQSHSSPVNDPKDQSTPRVASPRMAPMPIT